MTEIFDKEQTPIRLVDCVQLQLQDEEIKSTGWICPFCKKKQKKIKKQLKFRYGKIFGSAGPCGDKRTSGDKGTNVI